MRAMIYLPMTATDLGRFRDGGTIRPLRAFGATSALREAFGYSQSMAEEAEHAAQLFASLSCLVSGQRRLVVAAELDVRSLPPGSEAEFGEVSVNRVAWTDVEALFADSAETAAALEAYAAAHAGQTLEQAWEDDATGALLSEHDLLWYAPTECGALVERLSTEEK